MDTMLVAAAKGVAEADTMASPNPWTDRQRLGLVKAFGKSIMMILFEPALFMRSMVERNPADGSLRDAFRFAGFTLLCVLLVVAGLTAIGATIALVAGGGIGSRVSVVALSAVVFVPAVAVVGFAVAIVVLPLISALFAHGVLALVDGGAGGMSRSAQSTLYASAAILVPSIVIGMIPLGGLLAIGWQCWILAMLLREAHRTSTGRAVAGSIAAIFIPVLLAAAVVFALFFGLFMGAWRASTARPTAVLSQATVVTGESPLGAALLSIREATGRWPLTPIHAVADGALAGSVVVDIAFEPNDGSVTLGELTARELRTGVADALRREADALATRIPPNGAPFRIGAAVFTYGTSDGDVDDWMFVVMPNDVQPSFIIVTPIEQRLVPKDGFEGELTALNQARKKRMMPPLPDPRLAPDVTRATSVPASGTTAP